MVKGVVNLIFGKRKNLVNLAFTRLFVVGVTRFERATSWSRTKHSTKLSHTPKRYEVMLFFHSLFIILYEKSFVNTFLKNFRKSGNFLRLPLFIMIQRRNIAERHPRILRPNRKRARSIRRRERAADNARNSGTIYRTRGALRASSKTPCPRSFLR